MSPPCLLFLDPNRRCFQRLFLGDLEMFLVSPARLPVRGDDVADRVVVQLEPHLDIFEAHIVNEPTIYHINAIVRSYLSVIAHQNSALLLHFRLLKR